MNVLIVDDSKIVRRVLTSMMDKYFEPKYAEYNIFVAKDGVEAMEQMQKEHINIILLDWNMPNMNGEEVVEAVRANKKWMKTRIVMATTEGARENVLKMIKKGANGYIVKPFNEVSIFKTLDTITARMPI